MTKNRWAVLAVVLGLVTSTITWAVVGRASDKPKKPPVHDSPATEPRKTTTAKAKSWPPLTSAMVGAGFRAFRIPAQNHVGAGSFAQPGERVDVLGVFTSTKGGSVTRLLAQSVRVLKVQRTVEAKEANPTEEETGLILELTPSQTQQILAAQALGKLVVTLRSSDDWQAAPTASQLRFSLDDPPPARQEVHSGKATPPFMPENTVAVTVVRGSQRDSVEVPR